MERDFKKQKNMCVEEWTDLLQQHLNRTKNFVESFLKRRSLHEPHPVMDFLFTYYSFSPTKLMHWVPSINMQLDCFDSMYEQYPWLAQDWFRQENNILVPDLQRIRANTLTLAEFIQTLCENVNRQPARFGCFGLHEWAMVYKLSVEEVRHKGYHLRLSTEQIAKFVDTQSLCCTHYDAYRFFTPLAKPGNIFHPTFDIRLNMEQGGCLHANMDLYKWSAKLWPWIGSDFIADTFMLALEGRELDMCASPYDLSEMGYRPIKIETEEGRKHYQHKQQAYAEKAKNLRYQLLLFCRYFIEKIKTVMMCEKNDS